LNKGQVNYLLLNYPALTEWLENSREDILHGYRQTAFAGGNRGSGHSDPTARKAEHLLEFQHVEGLLSGVGGWIDTELETYDRPVLIEFWRLRHLGLYWVARNLNMEPWRCKARWDMMTNSLMNYLRKNQSAGHAFALPGGAFVDGPPNTYPAL